MTNRPSGAHTSCVVLSAAATGMDGSWVHSNVATSNTQTSSRWRGPGQAGCSKEMARNRPSGLILP